MGAFGGFPTPPKLFIQLFNITGFRWFALFLLIWQGAGGGAEGDELDFDFDGGEYPN